MSVPFNFTLVIPVADRPRQLAACLNSLKRLLQRFPFAGQVSLLIAEDSADAHSIAAHRSLVDELCRNGFNAHHLDAAEQRALLAALPLDLQMRLESVLGQAHAPRWHHKGASVTRNIAYLWLARHRGQPNDLYWFFDSDQEFQLPLANGSQYEIDYFEALSRIFAEASTQILTGKVVGDPPVSPAVMAGTLLDDLTAFVTELSEQTMLAPCAFHLPPAPTPNAAYHDMADLFGFAKPTPFRYACELPGAHDHRACLDAAADRLAAFFDGVHPTRSTTYEPSDPLASKAPARTLYTGNFVIRADGLRWFIPFAPLRLRMAGPTLGRIIQAEIGAGFVTANLPMLHRRAESESGASEFRYGINKESELVDISNEFERQYFGDVMLFAMARLTRGEADTPAVVTAVEAGIQTRYRQMQHSVCIKIKRLSEQLEAICHAWGTAPPPAFAAFLASLRHNFEHDAPVWQRIGDPDIRAARCAEIGAAIDRYAQACCDWKTALEEIRS
jgi:hypothetical protein